MKKQKPTSDSTIKLFADVEDSEGKIHKVLQRNLPFLIPNGRKFMLKLRRQRQLEAGDRAYLASEKKRKKDF